MTNKSEPAKVTLLAKGTVKKHSEIFKSLESIEPEHIPGNLIHDLYVTLNDDTKYKIDQKYYADGLDYKNIEAFLVGIGIKNDIALIEIIINLESAQKVVGSETEQLLNKIFAE